MIDERISPCLTVGAIADQQHQIFVDYIMRCYPCLFKCTESRVPITCIEFVTNTQKISNAIDWSVRATTATYTGLIHNDARFLEQGILAYLHSLRGLAGMLRDEQTAKSDETLATAMALAIFEKYACSSPDAWLRHAAGIKALMRLRGADAHLHGFGHAMYISYRHVFIAAALITGEECFLQDPEWQAVSERMVVENAKQPDSSVYTDIVERGFCEMARLPGYVKRARDLLAREKFPTKQKQSKSQKKQPGRRDLLRDILASRASLRGIHTELGVSASMLQSGQKQGFVGPIPHVFFDGFSTSIMRGVRSGIVLLNYLVMLLDPGERAAIEAENRPLISEQSEKSSDAGYSLPTPPSSTSPRLVIESMVTANARNILTSDWMDRFMNTMGMDGIRVRLVED